MPIIRNLNIEDTEVYREQLIQYIYERNINNVHMESYNFKDAEVEYRELLSYFHDDKAIIYGAIEQNKLIGFIYAYQYPFRDDISRIYISILYVNKEYRSRHIGKNLLREIENYAQKIKVRAVYLHTEAFNTDVVKFYQRNGYEIERIQMIKNVERKSIEIIDWTQDIRGEIYELREADIKRNELDLVNLFLMNTKAHILADCFDQKWAEEKIKDLQGYVAENKAIVYGFLYKEELVGFIWVFPYSYKGEKRYLLNALTVLPKYRGKGIADILFQTVEKRIEEKGLSLYLLVDKANERAYSFYKKHGMKDELFQYVKYIN